MPGLCREQKVKRGGLATVDVEEELPQLAVRRQPETTENAASRRNTTVLAFVGITVCPA
jgi:hypothetical protein